MTERISGDENEMLDITDEQDNVIGRRSRAEIDLGEFRNIRTVNGFLVNQEGKLWIPRRTPDKKLFPSCLDMSFGGYVKSGEGYDEAFQRELKEELNIDAGTAQYTRLGKLSPYKDNVSSFTMVYVIYTDQTPQFNTEDFSEASWVTPEDLFEKLKNGEPAKSDLQMLVKNFLLKKTVRDNI